MKIIHTNDSLGRHGSLIGQGIVRWAEGNILEENIQPGAIATVQVFDVRDTHPNTPGLKVNVPPLANERCNRTACQKEGASFWNIYTSAWYCDDCALKINEAAGWRTPICFATK